MSRSDSEDRRAFTRRSLLIGAGATLIHAPSIVPATNLMSVRGIPFPIERQYYGFVERLYVHRYLPRILKLRGAGMSAQAVAAALNSCNLRSINGKDWDAAGIISVLRREQDIRREDAIWRTSKQQLSVVSRCLES